jgi:hypothetical protein
MDQAGLFDRWVLRLRHEQPQACAILCHGSFARGTPEPDSDLDLDVLVADAPAWSYRSAFEALADGRLLHATIQTATLAVWIDDAEGESDAWALYLPSVEVARLLWATPDAAHALAGRITRARRTAPQLQDLLEAFAKVRNARRRGDALGVALAAQGVALRVPALLALAHPVAPVHTPREALATALALPGGPGYRDDLLACFGLAEAPADAAARAAAAQRLTHLAIAALAPRAGAIADLLEAGLAAALQDGTLQRLVDGPV